MKRIRCLAATALFAASPSIYAAITDLPQPEVAGKDPLFLTQKDAAAHCARGGKRLPTPAEFAEWSVRHGAGIEPTKYPDFVPRFSGSPQRLAMSKEVIAMLDRKFHPVFKQRTEKGDITEFYFRAVGFTFPANQKMIPVGVRTEGERVLDSGAKFYASAPAKPTSRRPWATRSSA